MIDVPLASRLVGKTIGRWTVTEKRKKAVDAARFSVDVVKSGGVIAYNMVE